MESSDAEPAQSIVLEEEIDENYEPTDEEVREYAQWLGMDLENERALMWIASEGLKAPLPEDWKPCRSPEGDIYYFNFSTGESVWDHPCDEYYRTLYQEEKRKLERKRVEDKPVSLAAKVGPLAGGSAALGGTTQALPRKLTSLDPVSGPKPSASAGLSGRSLEQRDVLPSSGKTIPGLAKPHPDLATSAATTRHQAGDDRQRRSDVQVTEDARARDAISERLKAERASWEAEQKAALEEKKRAVKQSAEEEITQFRRKAEADAARDMGAIKEGFAKQKEEMESRNREKEEMLRKEYALRVEILERDIDKERSEKVAALKSQQQEALVGLRDKHDAESASLRSKHESSLKKLEEAHAKKVDTLRAKCEKEMASMEEEREAKAESMRGEIAELEATHAKNLKAKKAALEDVYRAEMEQAQTDHASSLITTSELKGKHTQAQRELSERLEGERRALEARLKDEMRALEEAHQKRLLDMDLALENKRKEMAGLEAEIAAEVESKKAALEKEADERVVEIRQELMKFEVEAKEDAENQKKLILREIEKKLLDQLEKDKQAFASKLKSEFETFKEEERERAAEAAETAAAERRAASPAPPSTSGAKDAAARAVGGEGGEGGVGGGQKPLKAPETSREYLKHFLAQQREYLNERKAVLERAKAEWRSFDPKGDSHDSALIRTAKSALDVQTKAFNRDARNFRKLKHAIRNGLTEEVAKAMQGTQAGAGAGHGEDAADSMAGPGKASGMGGASYPGVYISKHAQRLGLSLGEGTKGRRVREHETALEALDGHAKFLSSFRRKLSKTVSRDKTSYFQAIRKQTTNHDSKEIVIRIARG